MTIPKPWTESDDARLRSLAGTMVFERIARALHRSERLVKQRAKALGVSLDFRSDWTSSELEALRRVIAAGGTRQEVAQATGRTVSGVRNKARGLGLSFHRQRRVHRTDWRSEQIEALRRAIAAGNTREQAAEATRRSVKACINKALQLGLSFSRKPYERRAPVTHLVAAGPAPRERVGLPRPTRKPRYVGSVTWCDDCHAPVVDTPLGWYEHRQRVHIQPIRRIA